MAISLATLKTRVKTRIRADLATPAVNNLDDKSIETWANEYKSVVIQILRDPRHFNKLIVFDSTLTISNGKAALPADYEMAVAVKVKTTTEAKRQAILTFDPQEFNSFDNSNFVTKVTEKFPLALVANGNLYVKPDSITNAYMDYIKRHPTISDSQGTLWNDIADNVLTELIVASYFSFLEEFELAAQAEAKARSFSVENA